MVATDAKIQAKHELTNHHDKAKAKQQCRSMGNSKQFLAV